MYSIGTKDFKKVGQKESESDGWMDVYFIFARMVLEVHLWRGKHKITGWYITTSINL